MNNITMKKKITTKKKENYDTFLQAGWGWIAWKLDPTGCMPLCRQGHRFWKGGIQVQKSPHKLCIISLDDKKPSQSINFLNNNFELVWLLNSCWSLYYHVRVAPWTEELVSEECNEDDKCCSWVSFARPRTAKVDLHMIIGYFSRLQYNEIST